LRNTTPAIRHGGLEMLSSNHPSVLAYLRVPELGTESSGEPVLVIVNLGAEPVTKYSLSGSGLKLGQGEVIGEDLLSNTPFKAFSLTSSGGVVDVTPVATLKPRSIIVARIVPFEAK